LSLESLNRVLSHTSDQVADPRRLCV
jgi:hypothetical protein